MGITISIRRLPDGKYLISDSVPGSKSKEARAPGEAGLIVQTYKMLYQGQQFDIAYHNDFSSAPLEKDIAKILKGDKAFNLI